MDWTHPLLVALIVAVPPTLVGLMALYRVKVLHIEVNGKMAKLLELTGREALSRGELKGAEDERDRHNKDSKK